MAKLFSFILILIPSFICAQKLPTYLSLEAGGNGLVASVNYGRPIYTGYRYKLIFQAGLGWPPKVASSTSAFNIPTQFTCNFGQKDFFFEAGVGTSLLFNTRMNETIQSNELYISPVIGFRHESNNWFGRVFLCPLFHVTGDYLQDDVTRDFIKFGVAIGAIL
jgi:hypothetical protein